MLSRRNKWILSLAFCPLLSSSLSASSNLTDFKKSYPPICMVHDWDNHLSPANAIPQAVKPAAQTIPWSEWLNRGAMVLDRTIESSKQVIQQIYDQIPKSETLPVEESDLLCGDSNRDWCEPIGSQDVACFPISTGCCPVKGNFQGIWSLLTCPRWVALLQPTSINRHSTICPWMVSLSASFQDLIYLVKS